MNEIGGVINRDETIDSIKEGTPGPAVNYIYTKYPLVLLDPIKDPIAVDVLEVREVVINLN